MRASRPSSTESAQCALRRCASDPSYLPLVSHAGRLTLAELRVRTIDSIIDSGGVTLPAWNVPQFPFDRAKTPCNAPRVGERKLVVPSFAVIKRLQSRRLEKGANQIVPSRCRRADRRANNALRERRHSAANLGEALMSTHWTKTALLGASALCVAALSFAATITEATGQERVRWKMQSAFGSQLPHLGASGVRFSKDIERMSGG